MNNSPLVKILIAFMATIIMIALVVGAVFLYFNTGNDVPVPTPEIVEISQTFTPTPASTEAPIETVYLPYMNAVDLGFDQDELDELDSLIAGEIADGFPGAVLMIAKDGNIVFHKAYGYQKKYDGLSEMQEPQLMADDTVFDLASLTKVYSTLMCIMKLSDEGKIDIDDRVAMYLPNFTGDNKEHVTIKMLLTHCSGYTHTQSLYQSAYGRYYTTDRDEAKKLIETIPLDEVPNTVYKYSDTNYMLLANIIEAASGMDINEYAYENIYKPMGLKKTCYNPLENGLSAEDTACTERCGNTRDFTVSFDGVRTYPLQGEVHDANSYYSFEGTAGHAGLFSDAYGLTAINVMMLNGGTIDGVEMFSQATVDEFMNIYDDNRYQLGFWNASSFKKLEDYVSDRAFYHNGWTGVASVIDYEENLSIIMLTNKRHCASNVDYFETHDYELFKYTTIIQMTYDAIQK